MALAGVTEQHIGTRAMLEARVWHAMIHVCEEKQASYSTWPINHCNILIYKNILDKSNAAKWSALTV